MKMKMIELRPAKPIKEGILRMQGKTNEMKKEQIKERILSEGRKRRETFV